MNCKTSMLALMLTGALLSTTCLAEKPTVSCKTRSEAALRAFTHGEYKKATAHFAPNIASRATPAMLKAAWSHLEAASGAFRSAGELTPRTVGGQTILAAPLKFAHDELYAAIACNDGNQLTSFSFLPAKKFKRLEGAAPQRPESPEAAAEAKLKAQLVKRQMGAHPPIKAHVEADGVRVGPLSVSSPFGPLRGALTLPAGKGPFPAVLLVQGSGPGDLNEAIGPNMPFKDIADGLARLGVASLRYDKRTFDYPKKIASNKDFTVDDEYTQDVLTALGVLAKHGSIDPHRVFVLGLSEGAMLVPRFAHRDPHLAGAIMMAAPARPLLAVMEQQTRTLGPQLGATKAQIASGVKADQAEKTLLDAADPTHPPSGTFAHAPQSYWLSLHTYHQVAVAKKLSMPMLVLQGGSDFQVSPAKDFGKWKQALGGRPNVTFHLYPGLSHLFRPAGKTGTVADYLKPGATDPEVIHDIATWIKAQPAIP